MNRRQLLVGALGVASAALLADQFHSRRRMSVGPGRRNAEFLLGGSFRFDLPTGSAKAHLLDERTSQRVAFRLNLRTGHLEETQSTAPIHILEANPQDSNLTLGCSRGGRLLSMVDWKLGREVHVMELPEGRNWGGHLAFTDDGRYAILPVVEFYQNSKPVYENQVDPDAVLAVLDLEKWQIVDEIPTAEGRLHDVARADRDVFVGVSASHQQTPTIQVIDFENRKAKARTITEASGDLVRAKHRTNPGHLRIVGDQVYFALYEQLENLNEASGLWVGANWRNGQIAAGGATHFEKCGELLSVDVDESRGHLWITAPNRRRVLVCNLEDRRLLTEIEFAVPPRSVLILPEHELALVGTLDRFHALDLRDLSERAEMPNRWKPWGPRPYHSHTSLV